MYIASVGTDLKIHDSPTGQLVNTYKAVGSSIVKTISWAKDGNWIVLVPSKGPAEVIVIRDNILKHLYTIEDVQQPTCAVFQNLTKRNIALGTNTGNILVYDIKTKYVRKHFPRATSTVFRIEYGMKDNYLLAASQNGEILLYNSSTMNCSGSFQVPNSKTVTTIKTHLFRRNLFMAGSEEGVVAVWDTARNSLIHSNVTHQAIVTDVAFSPIRADLVVSCGLDRKFTFFDTTSKCTVLQKILDRSPTAVDFCSDGIGLAIGTQMGVIHLYDTRHMNNPTHMFKAHNSHIKQLLFQKNCGDDSGDYGFRIPKEAGDTNFTNPEEQALASFDLSGSGFQPEISIDHDRGENLERMSSNSDIQQDSFMDAIGALGMSPGVMRDSPLGSISKGVKKLLDSKPNLLDSAVCEQSLTREQFPDNFVNHERRRENGKGRGRESVDGKDSPPIDEKLKQKDIDRDKYIENVEHQGSYTNQENNPRDYCMTPMIQYCELGNVEDIEHSISNELPNKQYLPRNYPHNLPQEKVKPQRNLAPNYFPASTTRDMRRHSYGGRESYLPQNPQDFYKPPQLNEIPREVYQKSSYHYPAAPLHRTPPIGYSPVQYIAVENQNIPPRNFVAQETRPNYISRHTTMEDDVPVNVPLENLKIHKSSTPKYNQQQSQVYLENPSPMHISPIIVSQPANSRPAGIEISDFQNTVRQVVQQEVKTQLEAFYQTLKYDNMEALSQIRRNFLDMQMSIIKEFVQLETSLNRVREDLANEDPITDDLLMQENIRLRKELTSLRDQIINSKE